MSDQGHYLLQLKKESKIFYVFIAIAIVCPILSLVIPWRPEGQSLAIWFQRSGAMVIVFALIAEARAINVYNIINPSGFVGVGHEEATEEFGKSKPAVFNSISFLVIVAGTFIWGYGDLFF
jgi:hypothetical protein